MDPLDPQAGQPCVGANQPAVLTAGEFGLTSGFPSVAEGLGAVGLPRFSRRGGSVRNRLLQGSVIVAICSDSFFVSAFCATSWS
jgi:hypothetical protein